MLKLFSLPIVIGIALGILFPYQSMSLIWISSILLFLLLFLNTLAAEPGELRRFSRDQLLQAALTQGLIFLFLPLLMAAAVPWLIKDQEFVFGVLVSALAPCALVNPFFAKVRGADAPLSLLNILLSTLACAILAAPLLALLGHRSVFVDTKSMMIFLSAITLVPVAISFPARKFLRPVLGHVTKVMPAANSVLLAGLVFILVGSSLNRVPLRQLWEHDFFALVGIYLFFDFGLFLLSRYAAKLFMGAAAAGTLALNLASRNFAVTASLMLFFHPKAALPSAVGLAVHAVFFQWLLGSRSHAETR